MSEAIRKALVDAVESQFSTMLYGTTSNVAAKPQEPLTVATLQKMMASLPKPEVWLSTRLFPADNALTVEGGAEKFTVAHPMFWARLEDHIRKSDKVEIASGPPPMLAMNLTPIEIDPWPEDSPETAKWRAAHWDRLREAVEVAMTPLPEWLRSAPSFGKHG